VNPKADLDDIKKSKDLIPPGLELRLPNKLDLQQVASRYTDCVKVALITGAAEQLTREWDVQGGNLMRSDQLSYYK
jgi:hypothetical protein